MKILLLGPVHRETEFITQKGNKPFLIGQGQQSWTEALEGLGHHVFAMRYTDSILIPNSVRIFLLEKIFSKDSKWYGRSLRFHSKFYLFSPENILKNIQLVSLAARIKPDLVLISGGAAFLFPNSIETIKREYKAKIVLLSGIDPSESAVKSEEDLLKKNLINLICVNDRSSVDKWKKIGARRVIVLPVSSFDPKVHKKGFPEKKYESDVSFVGTFTKKRQKILLELTNFNLKIWGDIPINVPLAEGLRSFYFGEAHGIKMTKIFNSTKIALNFQSANMKFGGNMRTFEIPACDVLQLADKVDPDFFENGKEIVIFSSTADLKKKIAYYLQHEEERRKIAEAGYKRAQRDHAYERHFKKLLSEI